MHCWLQKDDNTMPHETQPRYEAHVIGHFCVTYARSHSRNIGIILALLHEFFTEAKIQGFMIGLDYKEEPARWVFSIIVPTEPYLNGELTSEINRFYRKHQDTIRDHSIVVPPLS